MKIDLEPENPYLTYVKYFGDYPRGYTVLASCDPKYLRAHGPAFVSSLKKTEHNFHIHVINASDDDWKFGLALKEVSEGRMTLSSEISNLSTLNPHARLTFYACNRFLAAPIFMKRADTRILITDIDSLFMDTVPEPSEDVGLFLRESLPGTTGWEAAGTKIAAGLVYYGRGAKSFARAVSDKLIAGEFRWFADQVALNEVFQTYDKPIHTFDSKILDWEFAEGTAIWTGKGARKHDNPLYVAKKKEFEASL